MLPKDRNDHPAEEFWSPILCQALSFPLFLNLVVVQGS